MHTLLPFDDFKVSALCLSDKLLEQQINDCVSLLETLHETDKATVPLSHPMVKAWQGCELQLCEFGLSCVEIYRARKPSQPLLFSEEYSSLARHMNLAESGEMTLPSWFGKPEVHDEYKGLLRSLDPARYEPIFASVETVSPEDFRYPI